MCLKKPPQAMSSLQSANIIGRLQKLCYTGQTFFTRSDTSCAGQPLMAAEYERSPCSPITSCTRAPMFLPSAGEGAHVLLQPLPVPGYSDFL